MCNITACVLSLDASIYTHGERGNTSRPTGETYMYINKATEYAVSRTIFKLEQAARDDDHTARWDAYAMLRELGIEHMFHEMPEHVQNKGDDLFYSLRRRVTTGEIES